MVFISSSLFSSCKSRTGLRGFRKDECWGRHVPETRLRLKSVWSIETFAVDEILLESFLAHFKKKKFLVMTHVEFGGGGQAPPTQHTQKMR